MEEMEWFCYCLILDELQIILRYYYGTITGRQCENKFHLRRSLRVHAVREKLEKLRINEINVLSI